MQSPYAQMGLDGAGNPGACPACKAEIHQPDLTCKAYKIIIPHLDDCNEELLQDLACCRFAISKDVGENPKFTFLRSKSVQCNGNLLLN